MTQVIVLRTEPCECGKRRTLLSHPVNGWRHEDGSQLTKECRPVPAKETL